MLQPNGNYIQDTGRPRFSDEEYGDRVRSYIQQAKRLSEEQWENVLDLCRGDEDADELLAADRSLADMEREDVFGFQSPKKQRT